MRKFTLILMLVSFTAFVFAQNAQRDQALTSSDKSSTSKTFQTKTEGEVLWSEDFTGGFPDGWTLVDLSDENMPWIWTTDTIDGTYTNDPWIELAPNANPETGHMHMPADGYNSIPQFTFSADGGDLVGNPISVDSYFQTPSLDFLGDQAGVVIGFNTFYRYFTGMRYEVEVSNDYNPDSPELAHWDSYLINENYISAINDPSIDEFRQINVSVTAANQSNVVIRFHAHSSSHYVWLVDNIEISVPYDNNIALNNKWAFYSFYQVHPAEVTAHFEGDLQHGGYYYKIPKSQVDKFVGFEGAIQNFGMNNQTNVKMTTTITYYDEDTSAVPAGEVVFTLDSELKNVDASDYDSLFAAGEYFPTEWGWYDIDMEVTFDNADGFPENNTKHLEFIVNDSVYSRTVAQKSDEFTSTVATRNWVGGGNDGDGVGILYTLYNDAVVEGMQWYFAGRNRNYMEYIDDGSFTYICRIFAYDLIEDEFQTSPIISADLGIITSSDFELDEDGDTVGTWLYNTYVRDGNSEYLAAGDYLVFIETNTGADPDLTPVGFYMGEDLTYAQPDGNYRLWLEGSWGWGGGNAAFNLVIDAEDWIHVATEEVKVDPFANSLGQNWPNPASEITTIKYRIDQTASITINVYDVTGKQVISIAEGTKASGRHEVTLDVSELNAGIYYYTLNAGHFAQTRKMVIIE